MTAPVAAPETLSRSIGPLGTLALFANTIIGAGIYVLPAAVAAKAGAFAPFAMALGAVYLAPIVWCFARVSSLFGRTGGATVYVGDAYGPFWGFVTGWLLYTGSTMGMAAGLNALVAYVGAMVPALATGAGRAATILGVVLVLAWVNVRGVRASLGVVVALLVLKLVPLSALLVAGLPSALHASWAWPHVRELPQVGQGLVVGIYAYLGFEVLLTPAGEARAPQRDLGRALAFVIGGSAVLYVVLQQICLATLPALAQTKAPLRDAAAALLGPFAALAISITAATSTCGPLTAAMMAAPRVPYAMAREGTLPRWLAAVDPVRRVPVRATVLHSVIVAALALSGSFTYLATIMVLTKVFVHALVALSAPRLLRRAGAHDQTRAFVVTILALAACVALAVQATPSAWLVLSAWLALGIAARFLWQRLAIRASARGSGDARDGRAPSDTRRPGPP